MLRCLTFVTLFISLFVFKGKGQTNLVVNPSFEDTVNCPYQAGDIAKATGWNTLCGSPDYFKVCNLYDWGVPKNIFSFQQPASGDAYGGFITYSDFSPNLREFPSCSFTSPLNIGTKYFVSFKVALSLENIANPTNCASNKIGAMFTMGSSICNSLITNNSPVYTDSVITDSLNWTRISGSFIADSAYTYMVIGNFFDDINTDTIKFFNSWWSDFAYYYLDDVCVSTDSLYTNNYSYVGITEGNSIRGIGCYPNPVINKLTITNLLNEKIEVEIYNALGELLFSSKETYDNEITVNLNFVSSGIFFVKIKSGNQICNYKLLKP